MESTMQNNKRAILFVRKAVLFLITLIVILVIPLYTLIRMIGKLIKPNFLSVSKYESKNFIFDYVVYNWLGDKEKAQNNRVFVFFLFPTLFAFILFVVVPFFHGIYLSMTDWDGLNTGRESFIGFANYQSIFSDVRFLFSFYRTILYSVLNIVVINAVAFSLALLVTKNLKLKNVYRAGFFMPNLIGGLVLGYIWQFIFNRAIVTLGGAFATSLLTNGNTALFALIVVVTWQYAGYIMMIYIAAIQNIPQDLVEASTIDGANAFQRLKTITLPLVAQAFTVAMFLTLVTSFKQFDTVVSLTQGGPATLMPQWFANILGIDSNVAVQSTSLVAMNIYNTAFANYRLGIGQSKAIVFFIFLLIISLLQVYFNKRKEIEL
jgi:raffinose/stachyose/melibiose transport system permease protein